MREIRLNHKNVAFVDDEDFEIVSKYKWRTEIGHNTYYAASSTGTGGGKSILMHRLLLGVIDPKINIDHRDGLGYNNKRDNLRVCTDSQNGGNRKISVNNTSGYKGVYPSSRKTRWLAQIQFEKKIIYLGSFTKKEDAAKAYDKKALELFGDFARLNFPTIA